LPNPLSPDGARGAYGLRLYGLDGVDDMLVAAQPDWPLLRLEVREAPGGAVAPQADALGPDDARIRLRTGGQVIIDRIAGVAVIETAHPLTPAAIIHPYLAPVAAVAAYWHRRESFHGGAIVQDGRAWAILADRDAGKSTLLARLALDGMAVLADDQVIVEDRMCFAGPRAVDLRGPAAEHLASGEPLGVVGARERWRLSLGSVPSVVELAGWFHLEWGEGYAVAELSAARRLELLAAHRGLRVPPRSATMLLDLAALPAYTLRRPRSWEALERSASMLLDRARA
jgi:hypothetical protein